MTTTIRFCFSLVFSIGIFYSDTPHAQSDSLSQDFNNFEPVTTEYGDILAAENVSISMRDGISIALDVFRPNDDLPHSTLYAAGPYPHSIATLTDNKSKVGALAWFVSQGYAVVVANVRGTGSSEGEFSFFARAEQQDHYEIIEWIADQPWSDTQIAGFGAGYYSSTQWQMAIQNPPHLACIAPINGSVDPFRELIYPGGITNNTFFNNWYERDLRLANAYDADSPRLLTYDFRLESLTHPFDDEYWQVRSSLINAELINVPVFAIHDWNMNPIQAGVTGSFSALKKLNVVNKILVSNPLNARPLHQDTEFLARELLPYYDWCFTERSPASTFFDKPRVRYSLAGQENLRSETNWPPANISHASWFLNSNISSTNANRINLDNENGESDSSASIQSTTLNLQQSSNVDTSFFTENDGNISTEQAQLRFISPPLKDGLEIVGPVMLELYVASSSNDMAVEVTLYEEQFPVLPSPLTATLTTQRLPSFMASVPQEIELPMASIATAVPETKMVTVTKGMLKASARRRDESASTEFAPIYSLTEKEPLRAGQVYRLDIALRQIAYQFRAGNKLVLEIKIADDGSFASENTSPRLSHSRRYPSRLWLPVSQDISAIQESDSSVPESNPRQADTTNPVFFVPR